MTIPDEVLRARAYLMHATQQPAPAVAAFVRTHGPVEAAAAIENGSAPKAALADVVRRKAPTDDPLAYSGDARFIVPESDEWPTAAFAALRARGMEPFGLWVHGDASLAELARRSVAVVGTRAPTHDGSRVAVDFSYVFARDGLTVIARAAFGIDECALRAASNGHGHTIAVLACGVDPLKPMVLRRLFETVVARGGLLVSEYPPTMAPSRSRAQRSQRIVAALACATVLVEGHEHSRTLGIARTASEFGRRVFAVPGPITSSASLGAIELLREGNATIISAASQVKVFADDHRSTGLEPETPRSHREVFVVRPPDPVEDVAAFEHEDDADAFAATFDDIGPVERVTVCDRAIAARLIASRRDEDEAEPPDLG